MDFLKKIFGKKDDEVPSAPSADPQAGGGAPVDQSSGGDSKGKHDQGHPEGEAGKNVCEFC